MLRNVIVIATLIVVCVGLYGDAEQDYVRQKLSIEVKESLFGGFSPQFSLMSVTKLTSWRFYEGFTKLKEPEFLRIAGYDEESVVAQKHRNVHIGLSVGGYSLIGVAVGLLGYAYYCIYTASDYDYGTSEYRYYWDRGYSTLYIALAVDLAAIIPFVIALIRGDNWMPLEQAVGVKDSYNASLRKELGLSTE